MLHLHHSNKLENLMHSLLDVMETQQGSVLKPTQILVQNPGMKRWLQQQISSAQGIAANLEFPLPSRFIWDIFQTQFSDIEIQSNYDSEVLRWRIESVLGANLDDAGLVALKPYLEANEKGLGRFQLAEKLASLFDQYLVYRPGMMSEWEHNKTYESVSETWQAALWRMLRDQSNQPHRAELIKRLVSQIKSEQLNTERLPGYIYVFAISALSPLYKNVLSELSAFIDVHFLLLNPCQHYWGDIQSKKQQSKKIPNELIIENNLLASLGQQGKDFIDAFYQDEYPLIEHDDFENNPAEHLLGHVQHSILNLSQQKIELDISNDQSIKLVSCYSELRELQVLNDYILQLLDEDETLQASDIVVMSSDINTLAPYIDAVFGQQPENRKLPYSISDQNDLTTAPLIQNILQWIKLPGSRITANEVMAFLELPALQRAYDIDDEGVKTIRYWIKNNHIHWGIDHRHKQQLGVGGDDLNSWMYGINKLMTAYLMNDEVTLFNQHKASECLLNQSDFELLGKLHQLLENLRSWSLKLKQQSSLQQWQQHINGLIESFLQLDEDEEWQLKPLRDEITGWQLQTDRANFSQKVDASLIHYLLSNALTQGSSQHYYLSGGINFCNLIPMRTIPFRVVCLLGMSNDRFPRVETSPQFDLIALHPQKGDRSRREDDRYMFLQSVVSAQEKLYISFVGHNQKDDSVIDPSVIVTELLDHIEQITDQRLMIHQTSLHVFSEINFQQGSYADQWLVSEISSKDSAFNSPIPREENTLKEEIKVNLQELINFYKNPAKHFMESRLNMSLREYDEILEDDEQFILGALERYKVNQKMVQDLTLGNGIERNEYLKNGDLSQQSLGEIQFQDQQDRSQELVSLIAGDRDFTGEQYFTKSISIGGIELSANISSYSSTGFLQLNLSKISGKHQFSFWLQHCFLCAIKAIEFTRIYEQKKPLRFKILPPQEAIDIINTVIENYLKGCEQILPFYSESAYAHEMELIKSNQPDATKEKIHNLWFGENFYPDREVTDVYTQTSLKHKLYRTGELPAEFFTLSSQLVKPMLDWKEK